MTITRNELINNISEKVGIDTPIIQRIVEAEEEIIFDYLSSDPSSEEIDLKPFKGISIKRTFVKGRLYSKGMFRDHYCDDHVSVKGCVTKYYSDKINEILKSKGKMK